MNDSVNLKQIEELKDILGDEFQGLIDAFLADSRQRLTRAREAMGRDDYELARREFHSLKGSCGNVGAEALAQLFLQLEGLLKTADYRSAQQKLPDLEREYQRVRQALRLSMV